MRTIPALACAVLLCVAGVSLRAHAQMDSGMDMGREAQTQLPMSDASQQYMDAMDRMNEAMNDMDMTGRAADDFAMMMIPHHQAAIDMAKSYLASGDKDPDLTALSKDVIAAQEKEIRFLKAWLAKHGEK